MAKKKFKVLFFIAGMKATDAEEAAMNKFTNRHVVCVRNASYIGDNDPIEDFDEVAGDVPPAYAEAAALKPKPKKEPTPPPVDPKTVSEKSPAAPSPVVKQEDEKTPPAGDATPKPPEPKPGAGKGWKANA